MKTMGFGMNGKAITIFRALPYHPKKKTSLSAYGGERVPVALVLRTDRVGRRDQRHQTYLKHYKKALYISLLTSGKLNSYLVDIDGQAQERMCLLVTQMAKQEKVTEQLKAESPMLWVGKMNEIQARAREIVNDEIIYS